MNRTDSAGRLFAGLSDVDETYLAELKDAAPRRRVRRLPLLLAAALLMTLLCGTVAAAVRGEGIADLLEEIWLRVTGRPMDQAQEALIRGLSQEIGLSRTVDGVTVTADSAAVGEDSFRVLLRVTGVRAGPRRDFRFRAFSCWPEEPQSAMAACGCSYEGTDGTGALLFLVHYTSGAGQFTAEGDRLPVELKLQDLTRRGPFSDKEKTVAAGEWDFTFELDLREAFQSVSLGDAEAEVTDLATGETFLFTAREVTVTGTGVKYRYDRYQEAPDPDQIIAVLTDGAEIPCDESLGIADGGELVCTARFQVPIDVKELAELRIGDTVIRVE